jgi:glucoamylase
VELKDKFVHWCSGSKQGVGAALSKKSFVHFTIANGILTETYFPRPDYIALHSLRFITNETDEADFPSEVVQNPEDAPIFHIITRLSDLTIKKEIFADPFSSGIFLKYQFSHPVKGVFAIFPFPMENKESMLSIENNIPVISHENTAISIRTNFAFSINKDASESTPLVFIRTEEYIKNAIIYLCFEWRGRIVPPSFPDSLTAYYERAKEEFIYQWKKYLHSLRISGKSDLYRQSIVVVKSAEDKKYDGATVASLAIPWGSKMPLSEHNGYHLVWVRDLFFTALAMLSAGERSFAENALTYMINFLMRTDGSFKQNSTILGEERWHATQMDQVAFPIILADKLGEIDLIKTALSMPAQFIAKNGPWSEQERWEELSGFSVYASALEARALKIFSKVSGDREFDEKANAFFRDTVRRTFTHSGIFGNGKYFVRISKGDAETNEKVISLKGATFAPKEMVSNDFLYAAFTGMLELGDSKIISTLQVTDGILRVDTPKGVSFYRYNYDKYGFDGDILKGRLWPILTAERSLFEMLKGNFDTSYLDAMKRFTTKSNLLPEQIFENGLPTESATPLLWSHAAFMLLEDALLKEQPFLL